MPDVNPGEVSLYSVKKIVDSVARVDDNGAQSEVRSGVANYIVVFQRRRERPAPRARWAAIPDVSDFWMERQPGAGVSRARLFAVQ